MGLPWGFLSAKKQEETPLLVFWGERKDFCQRHEASVASAARIMQENKPSHDGLVEEMEKRGKAGGLQRVLGGSVFPPRGTGVGSGPLSILLPQLAAAPPEQEAFSASALPRAFFITQLVVRPGAGGNVGFEKKNKTK